MRKEKGSALILAMPLFFILAISVGVYVYNSASTNILSETVSENNYSASLDQQEIETYNASIKKYIGENKRATEVKQLIDTITSQNIQNIEENGKFISLEAENITGLDDTNLKKTCEKAKLNNDQNSVMDATNEMRSLETKINSSRTYTVTAEYEKGLIVKIKIIQK